MNKNLERSLKDRIKAIAKEQDRVFNDVWKSLALERFLARLSRSDKFDLLIFKGGFLLSKYFCLGRETVDLDFSLRKIEGSAESVKAIVEEIISSPYHDGFSFAGVTVQQITHPHMNYPGYEVATIACLGQTKTAIRMDIGIGDNVVAEKMALPLLALNAKPLFEAEISLQAYPLPYIFAEKLETVIYRGGTNSRMKDFYDLILLFRFPDFDLEANAEIVRSVFDHRGTTLPRKLSYDRQATETLSRSWIRFFNTLENKFQENVPREFTEVVTLIDQMMELL